jgi:hypothetical protein
MKYRFYFNFPRVNEKKKERFVIHCSGCNCRHNTTNNNGFWTEWYSKYEDAYLSLYKLLDKFRDHDFEIKPCKSCK